MLNKAVLILSKIQYNINFETYIYTLKQLFCILKI